MREKDRLSLLAKPSSGSLAEAADKGRKKKKSVSLRSRGKSPYERKLQQAGLSFSPKQWLCIVLSLSASAAWLASFLGMLLALVLFIVLSLYFSRGYLEERAEKRKRKVVPQLAPFLDGLASALSTGFNLEVAVVQAAQSIPPGILRVEMDRVATALEKGLSVREALSLLRERITGKEVLSLVAAISLFATMGGSVLEPFRRLAGKIREQQVVMERANRDLVMVRQAFYILFFLAIGAPAVLMLIQPNYLSGAFHDSFGRLLLQIGQIMILGSVVLFKKMTTLKV